MKLDIIITGVGGQGILSIAFVLVSSADEMGLHVKQTEVHGMSQRGGGVESHVRIGDSPIHSDMIAYKQADFILGIEPMESLRFLKYLSPQGKIITSAAPMINISTYPELNDIYTAIRQHPHILLDAERIAKYAGSAKADNMVMIGAILPYIDLKRELLENAVLFLFKKKGDKIIQVNKNALAYGENASNFYAAALDFGIEPASLHASAMCREPIPHDDEELKLWKEVLDKADQHVLHSFFEEFKGMFKVDKPGLKNLAQEFRASKLEQVFQKL